MTDPLSMLKKESDEKTQKEEKNEDQKEETKEEPMMTSFD